MQGELVRYDLHRIPVAESRIGLPGERMRLVAARQEEFHALDVRVVDVAVLEQERDLDVVVAAIDILLRALRQAENVIRAVVVVDRRVAGVDDLVPVLGDEDDYLQVEQIQVNVPDGFGQGLGIGLGKEGPGIPGGDGLAPLPGEQVAKDMLMGILVVAQVLFGVLVAVLLISDDIILENRYMDMVLVHGGLGGIINLHLDAQFTAGPVDVGAGGHVQVGGQGVGLFHERGPLVAAESHRPAEPVAVESGLRQGGHPSVGGQGIAVIGTHVGLASCRVDQAGSGSVEIDHNQAVAVLLLELVGDGMSGGTIAAAHAGVFLHQHRAVLRLLAHYGVEQLGILGMDGHAQNETDGC